jgi:hypothetical protein
MDLADPSLLPAAVRPPPLARVCADGAVRRGRLKELREGGCGYGAAVIRRGERRARLPCGDAECVCEREERG